MRPTSITVVSLLCLLTACTAGQGDPEPTVSADLHGNGESLANLNDRTKTPVPPAAKQLISVTSVRVTAVDAYDETHDGKSVGNLFVQDFGSGPAAAFEGGLLFKPAYSPPSFRTAVGDVIDMSTQYSEFQVNTQHLIDCCKGWTTPELTNATINLRYDGVDRPLDVTTVPFPDLVIHDLAGYQDHGRKWLSMLVTLENVVVTAPYAESSGRGTILVAEAQYPCTKPGTLVDADECPRPTMACASVGSGGICTDGSGAPTITNELYDMGSDANLADVTTGTVLKKVTGIVTMFDRLHVAPRSASDIER